MNLEAGYHFVRKWAPSKSTLEVARDVGNVIDMGSLRLVAGIDTVQTLRPTEQHESSVHRYSGNFGLDAFPLHTDLAHWLRPPRYLVLRCKNGAPSVATELLCVDALVGHVGRSHVRRAVVAARPSGRRSLIPMPLMVDNVGLRWDSIFIVPLNAPAKEIAKAMNDQSWTDVHKTRICLAEPGDTLLVDNWRMLHGRTGVDQHSRTRVIERVYLSEIYHA